MVFVRFRSHFLLFLITQVSTVCGYVISVADYDLFDTRCQQLVLYGDAHLEGSASKRHMKWLCEQFNALSTSQTSTLVVLEDRGFDFLPPRYVNNTLPDLCIFGRAHHGELGNVTIAQSDMRGRLITWVECCADTLLEQARGMHCAGQPVPKVQRWLQRAMAETKSMHGEPPSIAVLQQEVARTFERFDSTNYPQVAQFTQIARRYYQTVCRFSAHCLPTDSCHKLFEAALQQGGQRLDELVDAIIELDTAIADAGFMVKILSNRNHYDRIVFFGGQAHAYALRDALSLRAESDLITQHGAMVRIPTNDQVQPLSRPQICAPLQYQLSADPGFSKPPIHAPKTAAGADKPKQPLLQWLRDGLHGAVVGFFELLGL